MTEMAQVTGQTSELLTVGQVAERFGVTVRTLHHYDEIGLLRPSERSVAGYRLYTDEDLMRLQHVGVYRRPGFALEEIALPIDDPDADVAAHRPRQRAAVMSRLDEMRGLVAAIDRALENEMNDKPATEQDMKELFGENFDDAQDEAQQRWGDTDAWKQSRQRTKNYTKADWAEVKVETDELNNAFLQAFRSGAPATSEAAMDAAEAHREHIDRRFYECSHAFHRNLGDLYVSDPRYTSTYDESLQAPGLAHYVRDAIHANADRRTE
jgi:DNA-binding transcriptional MerR regulator